MTIDRELLGPRPIGRVQEERFHTALMDIVADPPALYEKTELAKIAAKDRLESYNILKKFKVPQQHRRMIFD